jgi:hypothetical protein
MRHLIVIEDGTEYEEFARLLVGDAFEITPCHSAQEAVRANTTRPADALLIDMRFDRSPPGDLVGDLRDTAHRLFAGDRARALRYLQDQQGALILAALRAAGCVARAVFVCDFPPRRLHNLRTLYGDVEAAASFDGATLRRLLGVSP